MAENQAIVKFLTEDNEEIQFCVLEQTTLNGVNYLLVAENPDEDEAECIILKDLSEKDAAEAVYDIVEDDRELSVLADVFAALLEDVEIKKA